MKEVQGFISIFGKPHYLVIALWFIGVTGGIVWMLKNPVFDKLEYNQMLIGLSFLIAAIVGVSLSIKAKREDLRVAMEKELRAKEDAMQLEEHKAMLFNKTAKQEYINKASDKVTSWVENSNDTIPVGKYPIGYGISIEVKVVQTCKYAITRDNGRQIGKAKLS